MSGWSSDALFLIAPATRRPLIDKAIARIPETAHPVFQRSQHETLFLRPFPDVTTRREKISIDGGRYPKWAPDGSGELFYVSLNGAMMSAGVTLSPALALGPVTKLFDVSSPPSVITARPYDVSPRDGRFLIGRPAVAGRIEDTTVNVILNWTNELRQVTSRMR